MAIMKNVVKALGIVLVVLFGCVSQARAASIAYMTGTSDPWGIDPSDAGSPDAAMNQAFGTGSWDKYNGFDVSIFGGGYNFIYLDGGDGISTQFDTFFSISTVAALENFVSGGGRLFVNAARWTNGDLNLGFGMTMIGNQFSYTGNLIVDPNGALSANGAGSNWSGGYFSHDMVTGGLVDYIVGTEGAVLTGGSQGLGFYLAGGMTSPYWQSTGGNALRANILTYAATVSAVPLPAALPLYAAALGFAAFAARRRKSKAK
jgi:hypothetical protein